MLARLATFNHLPGGLDEDAVRLLRETVMAQPGVHAGYNLHDAKSGKTLSLVVFENEDAVLAAGEALARRAEDRRVGVEPDEVDFFDVVEL